MAQHDSQQAAGAQIDKGSEGAEEASVRQLYEGAQDGVLQRDGGVQQAKLVDVVDVCEAEDERGEEEEGRGGGGEGGEEEEGQGAGAEEDLFR